MAFRPLVVLLAGAMALLATACGAGGKTPCVDYVSMNGADQQNAVTIMLQGFGDTNITRDDVATGEVRVSYYCSAYGLRDGGTIDGILDSAPP